MRLNLRPGRRGKDKKIVALISNKNSGQGTPRAGLGRMLGEMLATPYWHYDTATLSELDSAVKEIVGNRPDIFAFTGGDGSAHQVFTRAIREYLSRDIPLPYFLYLPLGTMMNVGKSLGLDVLPPVEFAKHILEKKKAQERGEDAPFDITHLNPLMINDEYGFIYGSGLPVNFLNEYYKGKPNLGPRRAVKVILKTLWNELISLCTWRKSKQILTKPVHAKVVLSEGYDPPVAPFMTHTALLVSAVDQLGMGCRGMPLAMNKPNHFMVRSSNLGFWGLARNILALWLGRSLSKTFDAVVSKVTIEYHQPTITTVDGDLKPPSLCDVVSCGPTLKFITG